MQCPECHSEAVTADANMAGVAHCDNCGAIIDRRKTNVENRVGGPKAQTESANATAPIAPSKDLPQARVPPAVAVEPEPLSSEDEAILVGPGPGWRPAKLRETLARIRGIVEGATVQTNEVHVYALAPVLRRIDMVAAEALAGDDE